MSRQTVSRPTLVIILAAVSSLAALAAAGDEPASTPRRALAQEAAVDDAAKDAKSGESAASDTLAVIYTIHNEGYIEPCG